MNAQMGSHEDLLLETGAILQAQDYTVQIEAEISGLQVDVLLKRGRGRSHRRIIVECKAYSKLVGLRTIKAFATTAQFLQETDEIDEAWLVTGRGFTRRAREAAKQRGLRVWTLSALRKEYGIERTDLTNRIELLREAWSAPSHGKIRLFVVMPFTDEMDDVYILGIRWVAEKLGIVVERADDIEHNGEIIDEIRSAIRDYDGVIGDTTGANPNVCYEVGFAHALDRPTILICRQETDLPFDLQGVNHLFYKNVVQLREVLPGRLESTLDL